MRPLALLILLVTVVSLVNAQAENNQTAQPQVACNLTEIEQKITKIEKMIIDLSKNLTNINRTIFEVLIKYLDETKSEIELMDRSISSNFTKIKYDLISLNNTIKNLNKTSLKNIEQNLNSMSRSLENVLTKSDFSTIMSDFRTRELPQILKRELNELKNNLTSSISPSVTNEELNRFKNDVSGLLNLSIFLISLVVALSAANIVLMLKLGKRHTSYGEICV